MRAMLLALGLSLAAPASALADNGAGLPLAPGEAAGPWTLETGGHWVCVLSLSRTRTRAGYALKVPDDCAGVLPPDVVAWTPTSDGMSLIGSDGQSIPFDRWSPSLLVSKLGSGADVQLTRGVPGPEG